jgi:hypothetical protein
VGLSLLFLLNVSSLNVSSVYAGDNIRTFSSEVSEKELLVPAGDKILLAKEWYDYEFEVSPVNTAGSFTMRAVDSEEYLQALQEVQFPLEAVGSYKIYFLTYKLKDSSSTLALSFQDGSAVVFGNYSALSEEKLHQLAVHELGHQVGFCLMNDRKWREYRKLRGIDNEKVFNDYTEIYQNRPQELFAEDFRLLFGGDKARMAPHLNSDLQSPDQIPELKEFFLSLVKN